LSELPILLLLALTAGAAFGAVPLAVPALAGSELASASQPWRPAVWVAVALAVLLSLCCAGTLAVTVLGSAGAVGCLAGVSGCLTAAACARRLRRRLPALALLVVVGLLVAGSLSWYVPAGHGGGGGTLSLLRSSLSGSAQFQAHQLDLLLICWVNGAWVGWLTLFERAGVIACAVPMVVLVSDLVNVAPALQSAPLWPVMGAVVSGLALIGWSHQERQLARWTRLEIPFGGFRTRRSLLLVVGSAAALSLLAFLIPPLNRDNISARFFHSGPAAALSQKSIRIAPVSGYSGSVVPSGPIRDVGTPVLTYRTTAPGGVVYLAGVALSEFVDGNWYEQASATQHLGPSQFFDAGGSHQSSSSPGASEQKEVSLTVTYSGSGALEVPDLLYPGIPLKTPAKPGSYVAVGDPDGHRLADVDAVTPVNGVSSVLPTSQTITTEATISVATAQQLESAGTDYPSWLASYRNLPDDTNFLDESAIAGYALQMAAGATNPYQIALNIQNALRSDETYTLDPPATPAGTWPIIYFLEDSHQGYCQYFASAMGAMLRTLGVPSRLVNGFAPVAEEALPNGQRVVTQSDAHTWVQVYFPTYGWVNFEPTPDGYQPTGATGSTKPVTGLKPTATSNNHPGVRSVPRTNFGRTSSLNHRGFSPTALQVALAVLLLLLLGVAAAVAWAWRARGPDQLRRRLELPFRLALAGHAPARTLPELAQACAELAPGPRELGLREALLELAQEADLIAFGRGAGPHPAGSLSRWPEVRRSYPLLFWRAWRARARNRRRLTPRSAPRIEVGSW
jgi:transglutaminase-like putative cysteine protease